MTSLKKLLTNFGTVNSKSVCQTKYCRKSGMLVVAERKPKIERK